MTTLLLNRIGQISVHSRLNELPMIPADQLGTIRSPVNQVRGKIRPYSDPEQRGKSPYRWGPVLEHILEDLFITG